MLTLQTAAWCKRDLKDVRFLFEGISEVHVGF